MVGNYSAFLRTYHNAKDQTIKNQIEKPAKNDSKNSVMLRILPYFWLEFYSEMLKQFELK